MKNVVVGLAVFGAVSAVAVLVWLGHSVLENGRVLGHASKFYYPADLATMRLPSWNEKDEIPLAPHRALAAAKSSLKLRRPEVSGWDVRYMELEKLDGSNWVYRIELQGSGRNSSATSNLRILMDGNVWEPSDKEHR